MSKKKIIFLLQSFGDVVIALNYLNQSSPYQIIIHNSLEPLMKSLSKNKKFYSFGNSDNLFPIFDLKKSIFSFSRFIDVFHLRSLLKKKIVFNNYEIIMPKQRLMHIISSNYKLNLCNERVNGENIYDWWAKVLNQKKNEENKLFKNKKEIISIFPDSRIRNKMITEAKLKVIRFLLEKLNKKYEICSFGKEYKTFNELIKLILSSNLVISSDSLPLHLAYFYKIDHLGLYNKNVNKDFLTPYNNQHQRWIDNTNKKSPGLFREKLELIISSLE